MKSFSSFQILRFFKQMHTNCDDTEITQIL